MHRDNQKKKKMAIEKNSQKSLFDDLYCKEEEEKWGDIDDEDDDEQSEITFNGTRNNNYNNNYNNNISLFPLLLLDQDLFWDDEELQSLFTKERETSIPKLNNETGFAIVSLSKPRKEAVEWVLRINAHYGFSALTAVLAVNYLDRFLFTLCFQKDKPWMMQLAAVACLSLAAKVEETHVPLLLDLQVEDAEYVFDAKTIQRMELLVLTGLKWRLNPVTPLSFLDHVIRRLGLKSYIHWEFLRSCENLLLSVISDSRLMHYLPSVLVTAIMLYVIHKVDPCNAGVYENQLLGVLKISKEEVDECYEIISDVISNQNPLKRKFCQVNAMDAILCCDDGLSSNDSWASSSSCISSSSSSSPCHPIFKKTRKIQEQQMRLPSLARVSAGSPH